MLLMRALDLTRELMRFDTILGSGDERPCARHLGAVLERCGFSIAYDDFEDRRTNLVARIGGAAERPPLCFTGHLDVVPLGAKPWRCDPFEGEIQDGRLYGRGSSDMKSGVAAFVVAACDLAKHLRGTAGLVLVITGGEETGLEGARFLAAHPDSLGKAGAIVVAEPTSNRPFAGHRGVLWLRTRARGVTAHGSMPEHGVNAIYKAARAVTKLESYRFPDPPHPILGAATLNVGTMQGGLNVNSVPDAAEFTLDIRTLPAQRAGAVRDDIARLLGDEVEIEIVADQNGLWTDPGDPWFAEVIAIAERITGPGARSVGAMAYATDGAILKPAMGDASTVILGPGEAAMAHQTDEYCVIDRIDEAVEIYQEIARRYLGI
jgi:succinyl-diaminopimelate desuccinylase